MKKVAFLLPLILGQMKNLLAHTACGGLQKPCLYRKGSLVPDTCRISKSFAVSLAACCFISLCSIALSFADASPGNKQLDVSKNKNSTPLGHSLRWIPADAAFYRAALRNREQIEIVTQSRAWAQLSSMPVCRECARLLSQPFVQTALKIGKARLAEKQPATARIETLLDDPQMRRFLEFLCEICSDEIFVYGGQGVLDLANRVTVPDVVLGFKIRDQRLAAEQLGKLELILGMACWTQPKMQGRMGRERIGGANYMTFKLDTGLLPDGKLSLPSQGPLSAKRIGEKNAEKLAEKINGLKVTIAVGIKADYLLVSVGPSTGGLAKLIDDNGKNEKERLIDRAEIKPIAPMLGRRLTSIVYRSRKFNETLGGRGQYVAASLLTTCGLETYCYDYGQNPWPDGYKPLDLLDHVGGRPLIVKSFRPCGMIDKYDRMTKWIGDAYARFEDRVLWNANPKCRKTCRLAVALLRPILRQIDRVNRRVLIPTLQDGQLVLVINDDGPALITDTAVAERFREVYEEYWLVYRDVKDAIEDVRTRDLPDFNAATPNVSSAELPAWTRLDGLAIGRTGRVVILATSKSAAQRLVKKTPPALGNMPAKPDHPRATAAFVDTAALIDLTAPSINRSAKRLCELFYNGSDLDALQRQVELHVGTVLECLKVLRSVAVETYTENGAMVTHTFWELKDLD